MRIAFIQLQKFHEPILGPLHEKLAPRYRCMVASHWGPLIDFRPHIVITCQNLPEQLRELLSHAILVQTRHGLASKQISYHSARQADFLCVTSDHMKQWYVQAGALPRRGFWVVGYLQMDSLFRQDRTGVPMELDPGRKVVLYAPTYNRELSSAEMLGDRIVDLIRGSRNDITLVIKPHPHIPLAHTEWMRTWQRLASIEPHVFLADSNQDVMPFLRAADLLITDASSVQLEYLALDRPMILINNPRRFDYNRYDPRGFEWTWRDMGEQIDDTASLATAVDRALSNPADRAERRAYYRGLLFGELADGRTAERICAEIDKLATGFPADSLSFQIGWNVRRLHRFSSRLMGFLCRTKSNDSTETVQPIDGPLPR